MSRMESEKFYDSLDEESDFYTRRAKESDEKDDIIPFYNKNIRRDEIELSRTPSKINVFSTKLKKKKTTRRNIGYNDNNLKSRSYLDMFYARSGVSQSCTQSDGSFHKSSGSPDFSDSDISPCSFMTCDDSDGDSFYLKSGNSESCHDNHSTLRENPDLALPITEANNNSKKVSMEQEQHRKIDPLFVKKSTAMKRTHHKTISSKLPEMGRLGPEIPTDKLELLRRRQQYGRRVSQTYGIKMKEKKVLENLKLEISNSKICT